MGYMENPMFFGALAAVLIAWVAYKFYMKKKTLELVQAKLSEGAGVVDVRTREEFDGGHFQGARNIPLQELQERIHEMGDKNQALILYCASGARSAMARRYLQRAGYTDVVNAGGIGTMMSLAS